MRTAVFDRFRRADYSVMQADAWPGIYGDAVTLDMKTTDPREWMAVLEIQYAWLRRWAEGDFEGDGAPAARSWDDMTPAEQAAGLDRGVLDHTIGGPFHPGAEFTWPMRQPMLYDAPFRIKRRKGPAPDLPLAAHLRRSPWPPAGPWTARGPGTSPAGWPAPGRPTRRAASPPIAPTGANTCRLSGPPASPMMC